jgi:LmbE family N-acetylglucosaminyl deacetylase
MHTLPLVSDRSSGFKVLCLGAHSDDIEIGCGGTILQLIRRYHNLEFYWVVFSSNRERGLEARQSAARFLNGVKRQTVIVKNFRESFFPYVGTKIKEYFEELKEFSPDLIFTHYRCDLHQDHRILCELTWNAFRNHLIWEYEVPKYDGDLGSPNCFVPLDAETCKKKIKYITEVFKTQSTKHWLTPDTFQAIMRLRGVESNAPHKFAEAFYCRKMIF